MLRCKKRTIYIAENTARREVEGSHGKKRGRREPHGKKRKGVEKSHTAKDGRELMITSGC